MWREIHQRDKKAKKSSDMKYEHEAFNFGQGLADGGVYKNGKKNCSPKQQCSLVGFWDIVRIVQDYHALDERSRKVTL